jgi:hypothetical protein
MPSVKNIAAQTSFGMCCLCEGNNAVVIVFLTARSPVADHGWGCAVCGISANGAIAVLCKPCAGAYEHSDAPNIELHLKWACRGYPATEGRIPFEDLRGEHQHVRHRHPEVPDIPPLTVAATDTRWPTHIEEGPGCLCSRCHQTIHEGTIAIRAFVTNADDQYRYHGVCFGAEPSEWEDPYEDQSQWVIGEEA